MLHSCKHMLAALSSQTISKLWDLPCTHSRIILKFTFCPYRAICIHLWPAVVVGLGPLPF